MLHPISALNDVLDEYADYLRTEFRARDPQLRQALENELSRFGFLAQEPFYQAHRPFKPGSRWRDLPLDPKLADALAARAKSQASFLHQSRAIQHLLGPEAGPLVVTTGTGSGKTECFLAPVIQNAFEDSVAFKRSGLTALLVYPMNALANDQEERIKEYLAAAGWAGAVRIARYDRGTDDIARRQLRENPPHILLTNYVMLEYLLVRPADREALFANHRCRFLVLDEVHTYRGALGSNIALLVRRLKAHLQRAKQDWQPQPSPELATRRFPKLLAVGTSATIKSIDEAVGTPEEVRRLRDEAVQQFFGTLSGTTPSAIRVLAEELQEQQTPAEATYPPPSDYRPPHNPGDPKELSNALAALSGSPVHEPLAVMARRCRLLWDLNSWLIQRPMSLSQLVATVRQNVPERAGMPDAGLRAEVETALVVGGALPEGTPGLLRLRAHRFFRGGWRFHRCLDPKCGRLYPKGEEKCECGTLTAPLYLCRNCGADYLRFVGEHEQGPLVPSADSSTQEWLLCEPARFPSRIDDEEAEESLGPETIKIRGSNSLNGSFDPASRQFSTNADDYAQKVTLLPGRTRCLCCGSTAGSRNVITQVGLGTSAAVKVLSEGLVESLESAHKGEPGYDGKERLLVFSDSRQDAAHQARFIIQASRYDRMRRALVQLLDREGTLLFGRAVELLGDHAIQSRDRTNKFVPQDPSAWLNNDQRSSIRAWEEAPLLDDLSMSAGYRGTILNLGLIEVVYQDLDEYVAQVGPALAARLGIDTEALTHLCRCLLDEMRVRGALNRELLRYHIASGRYPDYLRAAEWERRVKEPKGYAVDEAGLPCARLSPFVVPRGITLINPWRAEKGRAPSLERIFRHLLNAYQRSEPGPDDLVATLKFLQSPGGFLTLTELAGFQQTYRLLQVSSERVQLRLSSEATRRRCRICGRPGSGGRIGAPCPSCSGTMSEWPDTEVLAHRSVRRIKKEHSVPLVASEHTAQVPGKIREDIEAEFKAKPEISPRNLLACSPTLEMGIDVGGLDSVVLRNIPPRPDNYAQRGGRAGRRSRIGLVLGYARNVPHDQYFYDSPAEMIAGEVPAPPLNLANRDVILRHLNAIAFGAAEPGLAGRMVEYVGPDGAINEEAVNALISGVAAQSDCAVTLAIEAWGSDALAEAGLDEAALRAHLAALPARIREVFDRTSKQVRELRRDVETYSRELTNSRSAVRSGDMIARLLGIQSQSAREKPDADDRSAGYPLRRFAEFGILPGYEFPSEPANLRLLRDPREDDPISAVRRFGIGQFQPDALVYARGKRWRAIGLDLSSPWNPPGDASLHLYKVCQQCRLRMEADHPACPRCRSVDIAKELHAREYGGFLARIDEASVLDEEDRIAAASLVTAWPQWNGDVAGRWKANGWHLRLGRSEEIWWINEGKPVTDADRKAGRLVLHEYDSGALGHQICPSCGHLLTQPVAEKPNKGRKQAKSKASSADEFGHAASCDQLGKPPRPSALLVRQRSETLKLLVPVPTAVLGQNGAPTPEYLSWAYSLGYALRAGIRHRYMLDDSEIEFVLEQPWQVRSAERSINLTALTFVDPALGGAGFLRRAASEFDQVAAAAIDHLSHSGCESACYRCLKDYRNQRHHEHLHWPSAVPSLEALAAVPPEPESSQIGDIEDPRPWLNAFDAGVGSPLELKFLKLFEENGLELEKQFRVPPENPISIADFAAPKDRVAIYVDGAAYHVGDRLRRDRYIRERLRTSNDPWKVIELQSADLADPARVITQIRSMMAR